MVWLLITHNCHQLYSWNRIHFYHRKRSQYMFFLMPYSILIHYPLSCDSLPSFSQISLKLLGKRKHFNRCPCTLKGIYYGFRIVFTLLTITSFHLFMEWFHPGCCNCTWSQHRRLTGAKLVLYLLFCQDSLESFTHTFNFNMAFFLLL